MIDKQTRQMYYLIDQIPHAGRGVSSNIEDDIIEDDLEDESELRASMASFSLESLSELGWETMIIT